MPQDAVASSKATIIATYDEVEAMASNLKKTVLIQYTRDFQAPIESGEVMGTLTYFPEGQDEVVYDLIASRSIAKRENAPMTLAEIIAAVDADENPLPPITAELVIVYIVLPLAALILLIRLAIRLIRRRRRRTVRAPRVKHHHLK